MQTIRRFSGLSHREPYLSDGAQAAAIAFVRPFDLSRSRKFTVSTVINGGMFPAGTSFGGPAR
jgi:hypothetical protein